jgi:hypothetical protein
MGARVAKQRAANRFAKKRAFASPAPAEGNSSVPVNKKQVSALTGAKPNLLTDFKVVPTCKTRDASKNPSAETASTPTGTCSTVPA